MLSFHPIFLPQNKYISLNALPLYTSFLLALCQGRYINPFHLIHIEHYRVTFVLKYPNALVFIIIGENIYLNHLQHCCIKWFLLLPFDQNLHMILSSEF